MKMVNIHDAKTHLSRLVDDAVQGQPFVIAKAGKPLVKVTVLGGATPRRTGFLAGQIDVPADFDDMAAEDIAAAFQGLARENDTEPQGAEGQVE